MDEQMNQPGMPGSGMPGSGMPGPPPGEGFRVDPGRAFHKLQQRYAEETARMAGDLAAKDAAIDQLAEENQMLRQQIDMLSQRVAEMAKMEAVVLDVEDIAPGPPPSGNGNGPIPSIATGEHVPYPTIQQGPPPES